MQTSTDVRRLTNEAKQLLRTLTESDNGIRTALDSDIEIAWRFGKQLNQLKKAVGHGAWEKWRKHTFPKLDDRKAQRCQALDALNPKASKWTDLSEASVRQYRHIYVPAKKKPKHKGDKTFARPAHHASVVSECNKLQQRIDSGQYKPNEDELLQDFEPFYNWLGKRYAARG